MRCWDRALAESVSFGSASPLAGAGAGVGRRAGEWDEAPSLRRHCAASMTIVRRGGVAGTEIHEEPWEWRSKLRLACAMPAGTIFIFQIRRFGPFTRDLIRRRAESGV